MSVVVKEDLQKKLSELVNGLPVETILEVIDFAEFLRVKTGKKENQVIEQKERVAGLNQGEIWMSDDFNDYLGDEFWFGEDYGIVDKDNESAA
ncbi:MAG: DUF2281 domain-containing protein [Pyrinomonadaceae bacterium]